MNFMWPNSQKLPGIDPGSHQAFKASTMSEFSDISIDFFKLVVYTAPWSPDC